ncbi:MAG: hypothetical protein MUO76_02700 [Anaerolineaceae bacterium]|nr:hypothetical protein [Anaerolineaceae bacterium]
MDLKEERHMILDMVSEGKISVEEAKTLLDALEQSRPDKRSARRMHGHRTVEIPIPPMPDVQKFMRSSLRPLAPYMDMAYEDLEEELEEQREKIKEQREKMKEQQEELQEELERMREELKIAREELRQELGDADDE